MTRTEVQLDRDTIKQLVEVSRESMRRFHNASEHIRNRGLKLILKAYVQQRAHFADVFIRLLDQASVEPPNDAELAGSLSRGWTDIKTTMIVRRHVRQQILLNEVADEEDATRRAYDQALQQPLPSDVEEMVRQQAVEIERVQRRLRQLAGASDARILARLYDDAEEAQQVLSQLERAGFGDDDIYTARVEAVEIFGSDASERRRSMKETVLTAGGIGAGVGLVLSGLVALAHRFYFFEAEGTLADTPAGVTIEVLIVGTAIGLLFGVIFGALIGRDAAEDDSYLYAKSLQQGDTLVAVFTNSGQISRVEQIVGLRHQFEVEPAAS